MTKCHSCRRDLNRNITSSLAASLIELVPHQCKFAKFGCKVQDLLSSLVNHEKLCEVRTIKCPRVNCPHVLLKDFDQHVMENKCFPLLEPKGVIQVLYFGLVNSDGTSKLNKKEFVLKNPFQRFGVYNFFDKNFYVMEAYSPQTGNFIYCVTMAAMTEEDVEGFTCQITVSSKDEKYKIDFTLPVLPIEGLFPINYYEMLEKKLVFIIPFCMMKHYVDYEKIQRMNGKVERVFYILKVDIKKNPKLYDKE